MGFNLVRFQQYLSKLTLIHTTMNSPAYYLAILVVIYAISHSEYVSAKGIGKAMGILGKGLKKLNFKKMKKLLQIASTGLLRN